MNEEQHIAEWNELVDAVNPFVDELTEMLSEALPDHHGLPDPLDNIRVRVYALYEQRDELLAENERLREALRKIEHEGIIDTQGMKIAYIAHKALEGGDA